MQGKKIGTLKAKVYNLPQEGRSGKSGTENARKENPLLKARTEKLLQSRDRISAIEANDRNPQMTARTENPLLKANSENQRLKLKTEILRSKIIYGSIVSYKGRKACKKIDRA